MCFDGKHSVFYTFLTTRQLSKALIITIIYIYVEFLPFHSTNYVWH
jgi:hypothetical protein